MRTNGHLRPRIQGRKHTPTKHVRTIHRVLRRWGKAGHRSPNQKPESPTQTTTTQVTYTKIGAQVPTTAVIQITLIWTMFHRHKKHTDDTLNM